jgi:hypothetical protein
MYDVAANQQRNAKAAFFDRDSLQLIHDLDIGEIEY